MTESLPAEKEIAPFVPRTAAERRLLRELKALPVVGKPLKNVLPQERTPWILPPTLGCSAR